MKNVLFLFVVALVVWLQIFLSKMKNKWLGLILPILSFIYSLIMVSGIVVFETMGKGQISKEKASINIKKYLTKCSLV